MRHKDFPRYTIRSAVASSWSRHLRKAVRPDHSGVAIGHGRALASSSDLRQCPSCSAVVALMLPGVSGDTGRLEAKSILKKAAGKFHATLRTSDFVSSQPSAPRTQGVVRNDDLGFVQRDPIVIPRIQPAHRDYGFPPRESAALGNQAPCGRRRYVQQHRFSRR